MREEILKITMTVDDEKVLGTTTDQVRGPRGYSAYEVAVLLGYVGNEESWLESLKVKGDQGRSAYRVAVDEGFVGTVNEWRDSLIGPRGPVYDDSDLREQIDLELASLTRIASEAADVATTKADEAVDAKDIVVLRADEVDGHAVILYGLFNEIEDYRQEVYRRALESVEQAGIATTKAGIAVDSAGEAEQSAQAAAQSASEAEQTLIDKVSKTDIVQTKGQSPANIMSQKAVTDLFNNLVPWLGSEIPVGEAVFDFEKNRYAVRGVPVGLSDVSEFIRLSSATEWQEGKLVEVQNNIPRISGDGLLIEPQHTNLLLRSIEPNYWFGGGHYIKEFIENIDGKMTAVRATRITSSPAYTGAFSQDPNMPIVADYIGKETNNNPLFRNNATTTNYTGNIHIKNEVIKPNIYRRIDSIDAADSPRSVGDFIAYYINGASAAVGLVYTLYALQILESESYSSLIITGASPATRSPDILNIPLLPTQTLTGDWDEGVTYEVVDNIATFTGHGHIRNITVEEL